MNMKLCSTFNSLFNTILIPYLVSLAILVVYIITLLWNLLLASVLKRRLLNLEVIRLLIPRGYRCNLKLVIFKLISRIDISKIYCEIYMREISQNLANDKSTSVQGMAWWLQAISQHLSQSWPRPIRPYGVAGLQRVNRMLQVDTCYQLIVKLLVIRLLI